MKLMVIVLGLAILQPMVIAHPVIWSGGRVVTLMATDSMREFKSHYSLNHRVSFGVHAVQFDSEPLVMAQANGLLKRWNADGAQANAYLFSGLGTTVGRSSDSWVGHLGGQVDWETRSLHTYFSYDGYYHGRGRHILRSRFGVAPYLGGYDDIHTWVMLQLTHDIDDDRQLTTVLPLVRLFKRNLLIEFGTNFTSRYLMTAMIHF